MISGRIGRIQAIESTVLYIEYLHDTFAHDDDIISRGTRSKNNLVETVSSTHASISIIIYTTIIYWIKGTAAFRASVRESSTQLTPAWI